MTRPSLLLYGTISGAVLLAIAVAALAVRWSARDAGPAAAVGTTSAKASSTAAASAKHTAPAPRPLVLDHQRAAEILRAAEAVGLHPELGALAEAERYIGEGARERFLRDRVAYEWELGESLETGAAELKESLTDMRSGGRPRNEIELVQGRIDDLTTRAHTHRVLAAYLRLKLPAAESP